MPFSGTFGPCHHDRMAIMGSFPAAPADQVTLANWRQAPFNRWAFQHVREIIPTADIANDPDLQSHEARIKNAPKIIKALQETMPSRTTEEWIAILQPKDVFCERVNNYSDYLEHPHVKETGAIDWIEQDGFGRMPVANIPGLPLELSNHKLGIRSQPPKKGENTRALLSELGYDTAQVEAWITQGVAILPDNNK